MIVIKKLFWLLILLVPFSIKAVNCDYQDLSRYQQLASNINFSYDYIEANNSVTFNITVSNMPDELYIIDTSTGNVFSKATTGLSETILYGYQAGTNYRFDIIPYDEYCYGTTLTKYVNLPAYNSYYLDSVCNGAESFSLCQKWTDVNLSHEEFVKQVNEYKNSNKQIENNSEYIQNDFLNKIIVGFLDNYVIILVSIIVVCTIGIIILSKKDKFNLT